MSPLPNRPLQPPKPFSAETPAENAESSQNTNASDTTPPQPQRPLMRPVARPQMPTPPEKKADVPSAGAPEATSPTAAPTTAPTAAQITVQDAAETTASLGIRQQPIPAPSEPMQYRAIGLLRGCYKPSEEQFTRGEMTTADGTVIEAVLLGRVMSLVKNHLDLEQDHLWVVYPRTREKQEDLHVQIVGVWEPENLSKPESDDESAEEASETLASQASAGIAYQPSSEVEDNCFSIRGEIIFHTPEDESMIVKIQQAPRKKDDRPKAFKLKLKGTLPGKAVGYFWDLQVQREGGELIVREAKSIGMIPPKKRPKGFKGGGRPPMGGRKPFRPRSGVSGGSGGGRPSSGPPPQRRGEPLPKPVKRKERDETPSESAPESNIPSEA